MNILLSICRIRSTVVPVGLATRQKVNRGSLRSPYGNHSSFVWWNAPTIRFGPVRAAVSLDFCMRDPSFFCRCPVFVVKPVVLMYL